MNLPLVRIDDRLIHGQVATAWLRQYPAEAIFVINDAVAKNEFQRTVLLTTAPAGLNIEIYGVDDGARAVLAESGTRSAILILTRPRDIVRLAEAGVPLTSINVGGMQPHQGAKQVTKAVSVDQADIDSFRALHERGVELEVRMVPTDKRQDLAKILGFKK